ncbi:protein timeless homolog [Montipora capricornis]|uniref:protein timeless homolog n=1 Tax=Montipora capricornis TaxID=246305 RepID=UPI0035F16691
MENLSDLGETLNTEIVCTLAGLGYSEGSDYYKSPDCLESLKDLVRFLRRDDTTCEIRRQLGYSEVLQNDLVAILKSCSSKEKDIFDMVIRLMVNLTQPAVLCFGNNIPEDRTGQHYYLDLVTQLQSYKEAFTEKEVMSVIGRELGRLLQMEWDERLEEDSLLIERILLLIRNILHIPANKQAEKRTDDDASIHDQVIWNLHTNGIDDLLLFIASSPDEQRWSMHILEIVSLMFREQNPESLAKAGQGRSTTEKKDDKRQLEILHQQELADKLNKARKFSGRHSRFGGTFYVQNMKSIDDKNQLIYHRPLAEVKNMSFDHNKTAPKKRKKQLPAKEMGEERRSTLSIRLFLKRFCTGFLQNCYNPLMHAVKDNLKHGRSQENDETYFLWAMRFFMEFSRHHDFRVDYIGETLSVVSFTDLLNIIIKFYDGMESNKAEALTWGRRLHLAIQAYKELLFNVSCMIKSDLKDLRDHAKIIQGNVFYTAEYRDTFLLLLRKFHMSKHTKSYLRDLIEAFHIFLKMLENYCSGKSHIIVQKKKKITKKKKRTAPAATPANWTPEETEQKWQDLASDLSAVLQGHAGDIPESIVPFDAASEIPVDEQKTHALSQIQGFLRNQQCADAVALLRAARDVWADDEQFGSAGISAEDEFICLNNIFKMDLPPVNTANENDDEEEQEEETIPEEEEMAAVQPRETEFSIQEFLNKLATPSVIQPYCWLLKFYKENKEVTNHAIIKMLHRVAIDLKTPSMLFQLSLFNTFHTILSDPSANQYKEMVKFTRYVVAKFFEKLPKNSVLLAELVIWKSTKDCYEIEEGYGSLEFRSASTNAAVWTFEEEEELRQLYDEYKGSDDLVDTIMEKMSSDTKNRRQIIKKLVAMKLVTNRKELHKKAVKKGAWSEEETEQLRALFDEYKNSEEDIVEKIMEHMLNPSKTRRQVINQLVNMGIVEDRKMLRKKRKKGERRRKKSNDDGFVVDDDNEDEESEGGHSDMEEGFDHQPSSSNGESEEEEQDSDDSDDTLTNIISKLKSEGLGEQLKWIQSKLQRIADDRQNTDNKTWQPLPLVTITEENEEALSNKLFKKALKKVGLKPPANEQETFWRIPVALNSDKLRKAVEDLNGKDTGENEEGNGAVPSPVNDKSKSRKETLAALAAARKKNGSASTRKRKERITKRASGREWRKSLKETTTESDGENHSDQESCDGVSDVKNATPPLSGDQNGTSKKRSKRRVKRLNDSDEDELDEENLLEQRQEGVGNGYLESDDERTSNVLVKADSVRSDIEEDNLEYSTNISDSEDISNNTETSKSEAGKKRPRIESDDSDSDDDEEFNLPLSYHKRARRVLLDDNDDNE